MTKIHCSRLVACLAVGIVGLMCWNSSGAQPTPFDNAWLPDTGKLALTQGFPDVDGAAGGGLVPFALITGGGTDQSWGADAHYTVVPLRDFRLQSYGVAVGALDRIELSYTADEFTATGTPLEGLGVEQHILGAKVRLFGDAVYSQDSWVPQTAIGLEYKRNLGITRLGPVVDPRQLGAAADSGIDYYLSATKVYLAQSLLVNATVRYTDANEFGLLGFGGNLRDNRSVRFESTVAYLLARTVAIGVEYRDRPHNLSIDDENYAYDAFVAWSVTRYVSIVAAYVRLGRVLSPVTDVNRDQDGAYLSLQVGF